MTDGGHPVLRSLPKKWSSLENEVRTQVKAQAQIHIASEVAERVKAAARQAATAAAVAAKVEVEGMFQGKVDDEIAARGHAERAAKEAKVQADKALRAAAEIAAAAEAERMKRKEAEAEMHSERKARLVAELQVNRTSDSYAELERKFQSFVVKVQDQTNREVEAAVNAAEARAREDTERQLRGMLELKLRAEVKNHKEVRLHLT